MSLERNEKGQFVVGQKRVFSEETRRKMSETRKAKIKSGEIVVKNIYKVGHKSGNTGKVFSDEHKRKISESMKGSKGYWYGKSFPKETIDKLRYAHSKERHWNWKGGRTPENSKRTKSWEWKQIRKTILKRDNHTCQRCLKKSARSGHGKFILQVHHKIPYRITKDDSLNNLELLCLSCHSIKEMEFGEWQIINQKM